MSSNRTGDSGMAQGVANYTLVQTGSYEGFIDFGKDIVAPEEDVVATEAIVFFCYTCSCFVPAVQWKKALKHIFLKIEIFCRHNR